MLNVKRDWSEIITHYNKLSENTVLELRSPHHDEAAVKVVKDFCTNLNIDSVIELGCGTAPMLDAFKELGVKTCGVTLLEEPIDHEVIRKDMHLSGIETGAFDLVASRHSLEHSPMPLLLLMEMRRIATKYALIVLPIPNERMVNTWVDHYSVMDKTMWLKLFKLAGWRVSKFRTYKYLEYEEGEWDEEYQWLLEVI